MNRLPLHSASRTVLITLAVLFGAMAVARAEPLDFPNVVRPILAEHCFPCHGQDEKAREAGLRLDLRETAMAKLKSGATAIVPEKPRDSDLVKRILSRDPDIIMPPPSAKKPLSPEQIKTLERWIAEGAPYSGHWAFREPVKSEVPTLSQPQSLIRNPIDAFVTARLQRRGTHGSSSNTL